MDLAQFKSDLKDSDLITNPQNNATDLYNQFHSVLSDLVDRRALLTNKNLLLTSNRPTDNIVYTKHHWVAQFKMRPRGQHGVNIYKSFWRQKRHYTHFCWTEWMFLSHLLTALTVPVNKEVAYISIGHVYIFNLLNVSECY